MSIAEVFARARREHAHHDEMLAFQIFNWDCGILMRSRIDHEGIEPTNEDLEAIERLKGKPLYEIRPKQRTSKVIDENTQTPQDIAEMRNLERADRAKKMAAFSPEQRFGLEQDDACICDLLPPPMCI